MSVKTTRRSFLKGVCATGAAGALGSALGLTHKNVFAATTQAAPVVKEYRGLCLMCKHSGCSNIITMEDGVITSIKGNPLQPANKGTLCARGKSTIYHTYNPYRVKAPMKRTNPNKGMDIDPCWQEISWSEALNEVGAKFKQIYDQGNALPTAEARAKRRKLLIFTGFGMSELTMNGLMSGARFPSAFGSTVSTTKGEFCAIHYGGYLIMANGPTANSDNAHCEYQIMMGRGAGVNPSYANGDARGVLNCMKENQEGKPMKLVCIDPVCTIEASLGEWVPIRPGGDLFFLMGMTKTILEDGNYDHEFIRERTNAPYLIVCADDVPTDAAAATLTGIAGIKKERVIGHFIRTVGATAGDTTAALSAAKPLIAVGTGSTPTIKEWDTLTATDKTNSRLDGKFDSPAGATMEITVKGKRQIVALASSVKVEPCFAAFKRANTEGFTVENMADKCQVPAATIRKIARDFVAAARIGENINFKYKDLNGNEKTWTTRYRPVSLITSRGVTNHEDGTITDVASKLINVLVGNLYVPGGIQGTGLGSRTGSATETSGFNPRDGILNPSSEGAIYGKNGESAFRWPPDDYDMAHVFPHRHSTNTINMQVVLEGVEKWGFEEAPEALFVAGGNPILANGSPDMCVESIKKIPFVVNIAYHHDEITQMSDILLVSPSMLETFGHVDYMGTECSQSNGEEGFPTDQTNRLFRDPVPMIYNTMEPNEVVLQLSEKIGCYPSLITALNNSFLRAPVQQTIGGSAHVMSTGTRYSYKEILDRAYKAAYGNTIVNPQTGETEQGGIAYMEKHSFLKTYSGGSNALDEGQLYPEWYFDNDYNGSSVQKDRRVRYQLYLHTQMESGEFLFDMVKKYIVNNGDFAPAGATPDPTKYRPNMTKKTFLDYMGVDEEYLQNYFDPVTKCITGETKNYNPPDSSFRLFAIPTRLPSSFFRIGAVDQNPWLLDWNNKFNPYYNSVVIHPDEAAKHSPALEEGEMIVVESAYDKYEKDADDNYVLDTNGKKKPTGEVEYYQTKGKVHISKTVHRDTCCIAGALGRINKALGTPTSDQVCLNKLLNGKLGYINPIHGGLETSTRVRIRRAEQNIKPA